MSPNHGAPAAESSSGWAFNLRTSKLRHADCNLVDSGSDSDLSSDSDMDESRMLDDLDISTREETVVYKPNPFSIAKINAAVRSTNRPPSTNKPSRPIKPSRAGKKTSIVDELRRRSKNTRSMFQKSSLQANSTPSAVPPSSKDSQHQPAPAILPKSLPKRPIHLEDMHIFGILVPNSPLASETISFSSGTPAVPHAPSSPLRFSGVQAVETCISLPFDDPLALSRPETCIIDAAAHAPLSHLSDIPDTQTRAPGSIRARPQPPHTFQSQRPVASYFSSPVSRPEILFPSTDNASLSSPIRTVTGPIRPIARSQPQSFFAPRRDTLQKTFVNVAPRLSVQTSSMLQRSMPLVAAAPQTFPPPTPVHIRPLPISATTPPYRNEGFRRLDLEVTSVPPFSWNMPAIPSPCADPQPKAPDANKHARISHKRRHASPSPPRPILGPNAYKPSIDSDEEWSTLQSRKKRTTETTTAVKRTGAFSLPGISVPGKKSGMSATSSKRVITFLPPPLAHPNDNMPVRQRGEDAQGRPKDHNPYPSPTHSTLSSLVPVCAEVTNKEPRASNGTAFASPYRPLSPPTSDLLALVEPSYDRNPCVAIDVGGVASRYHETRMDIRQVAEVAFSASSRYAKP
ncbi:uncharacterized protein BT62DRAFT_934810 [Guyanagaster necrorhizus]|uniref:Uncharacterized protein n=1 Tax=Guyanagaster necrorhizus TaxID=856835 RepID=A0A9P8AQ05_9AGAR|nr:uncharacterized protein BT62DRAFT_934810 [Guyanagaster necrorhizus MCA 3950]KAG7443569.1 hypothetical protein BT62DRAFT_934810 [Guyanagaster necrorhizus MCA 3950]